MKTLTTRIPLILFTGGMDSTLLLQNQVKRGDCDVLFVNVGQHPAVLQREQAARSAIITALSTAPYQVLQQYHTALPGISVEDDVDLARAAKLLMAATVVLDPHRHSSIVMGGVFADTFMTPVAREKAGKLWSALTSMTKWQPVPLELPLKMDSKREVLTHLNRELYVLTTSCESTQPEPCRVCMSCKAVANGLAEYHRAEKVAYI